jgi:hypothetical protein
VVHREGALQSVLGRVPGGPVSSGVVDEDVEPWVGREHLIGEAANLALRREVRREDVDEAATAAQPRGGSLGPCGIPADDPHPRAEPGETSGGGEADPAGAARDQHRPAGHEAHLSARP